MTATESMKKGSKMITMRAENKYQAPKIILMLVMAIILFLPANGLSIEVKSMKVIKTGTPVFKKDFGKAMANEIFGNSLGGLFHQNPYDVARPVIIRVEYTCDKTPNRLSSQDLETYQIKDKWGEWVADTNQLKNVLYKRCGEETPSERENRLYRARQEAKEAEEKAKAEEIKRADKIRFKVYNNGTVLDTKTNLMWAVKPEQPACLDDGCFYTSHEWERAKVACDRYRGGGYTDWRLPTIAEMDTLYENNVRRKEGTSYGAHITDLINEGRVRFWASDRRGNEAALFCYNNDWKKVNWEERCPHNNCWALPVRSATRKSNKQQDDFKQKAADSDHGENDEAIADLNKAIELDPQDATAYNNRGAAYFKAGKYNEAIADLSKGIELNPKDADVYIVRGAAYNRLGNYKEAIADCNKGIELNPKEALAYTARGLAYNGLGKYNDAIVDLNKAIELNPKVAAAYNNRGAAYNALGKYNKAITDLNKAIALDPKFANPYYHRARSYSKMGNMKSALQDLNKAIQLKPAYKDEAKTEKDFDDIRDDADFKRLTGI